MLADALDLLVVVMTLVALYLGLSGFRFLLHPRSFSWPEPPPIGLGAIGWGLVVVYLTVGWANTGRTFGKTVLGLRVLGVGGAPPRLWVAFIRALLCAAFPIGLLWSAISRRRASVQDLIARTRVVYDWEPRIPRAG